MRFRDYSTIRVGDLEIKGRRDPLERLSMLDMDWRGLTVLDVGCNSGGVLFALKDKIKHGRGVDVEASMIEKAKGLCAQYGIKNLDFECADAETAELPATDIVLMLSVALWVEGWMDVLKRVKPGVLVFEAHGTSNQRAVQTAFLRGMYEDVERIGKTEGGRELYVCRQDIVLCVAAP